MKLSSMILLSLKSSKSNANATMTREPKWCVRITKEAMKVLVVEDNSDIAMFYKHGLEDRQYKVTITTNGEECLKVHNDELHNVTLHSEVTKHVQPFDQ